MRSLLLTISCLIISVQAMAAGKKNFDITHHYAKATASVLNEIQTMDNYVRWLSQSVAPAEMEKYKELVKSYGINGSEKFPKFHVDKNKLFWDKKHFVIFSKKNVNINGYTFTPINKSLTEVITEVCKKIKCEKTTTAQFSLIPKAHAGTWENAGWGALIGGLAGGSFCLITQNCSALSGGLVGAGAGGLAGAAFNGFGGMFAGGYNRQTYNDCTSFSCRGEDYSCQSPSGLRPMYRESAYTQNLQGYPPSCNQGYSQCMQTDLQCGIFDPNCTNGCNQYAGAPTPQPAYVAPCSDLQKARGECNLPRSVQSVEPKK